MEVAEMVENLAKVGVMRHLQISGGVGISDSSTRGKGTAGFCGYDDGRRISRGEWNAYSTCDLGPSDAHTTFMMMYTPTLIGHGVYSGIKYKELMINK
jgi:hypothetical protein